MSAVNIHKSGAVAHLELNRPEVLNAIDERVCDELVSAFADLERDDMVSVIVVSGTGPKAFSSGADLGFMRGLAGKPLRRFIEKTWEANARLADSPLFSIGALHGYVLGGGLELALALDLRIADETTVLGLPEMSLGGLPGSGALQRLPSIIGVARTLELAALNRRLDAGRAEAIGLVNLAVAEGKALETAMEWASEIAKRPRESLRYAKQAVRMGPCSAQAAAFHGLVSDMTHAEPDYQKRTKRFIS